MIFFDTFETLDDMKEFHEHLPDLLDYTGLYSFFNGLCGTNKFFHKVASELVRFNLRDIGLNTAFDEVQLTTLGDETWQGIRRVYYSLPTYHLPTCVFQ